MASAAAYGSDYADVPFTGAPRSFVRAETPPRKRTADAWEQFVSWCDKRGLSSLPASGPTVASYLLYRCRETNDAGGLAHSQDRMTSWLRKIDTEHLEHGYGRPAMLPEVKLFVSRQHDFWREADAPRENSAVRALQRVLARLSRKPESLIVSRDRAILLIGAAGALSFVELATLQDSDVVFTARDGLHIDIGGPEVVWLPSVPQLRLCAPCAYIRYRERLTEWLDKVDRPSESQFLDDASHVCFEWLSTDAKRSPMTSLFISVDDSHRTEAMSPAEVKGVVQRRLKHTPLSVQDINGFRDQLNIQDIVYGLSIGL